MSKEISKENWEKYGENKSEIVKEIAKKLGVPVETYHISDIDVGDLKEESKKYEQTWKDWAHLRNDKSELVVKWAKECGIEVVECKPSQLSDVEDDLIGMPIPNVDEKGTVKFCPPRYVPAGRMFFMKDISDKITPEQVDEACKTLEGYVGHEVAEDFKTFWEADMENKK